MEIKLNTILRELNITLELAIQYLVTRGYDIEENPATMVDGEIYNVLKHHFDKNQFAATDPLIKRVIAVRGNKVSDSVGYPKPIQIFETEIKTRGLKKEDAKEIFKNSGYIFVKFNFNEIWKKYESTEFFSIDFEEDRYFNQDSPNSLMYSSSGYNASTSNKLPLIISGDINKIISEGKLELPYYDHQFVFIEHSDNIYGPISVQDNSSEEYEEPTYDYLIKSLPVSYFNLDNNYENVILVYKKENIMDYIITNQYGKNDNQDFYISNVKHLVKNVKADDYLLKESPEEIIQIINEQIPENQESYDTWVSSYVLNNPISKLRFEKFLQLKEKSQKWIQFIENHISTKYILTERGQDEIEKYIQKNKDIILEDYKKELKGGIEEELETLNRELDKKRVEKEESYEEKKNLENDINNLKNEKEQTKSKSEELLKIEDRLQELHSKIKLAENINELKQQEEKQDKILADVINKTTKYEKQLDDLKTQYSRESEDQMHKKLLDLKPYVDALNGFTSKNNDLNSCNLTSLSLPEFQSEKEASFEKIVNDLSNYLGDNNRIMKKEDIVDQITNIQQNFLTVYCGLPGVGKTSLASLFSEFLTTKECFLNIPVSRGWNSRKNLLGYFNPITDSYQSDEHNFVEILKKFNSDISLNDLPINILLDESNLSPMEHYWSDFISIYDKNSNQKFISIDDNSVADLKIPNGLRFISTVNNDHTTELLSPRLIDRASFIKIKYTTPNLFEDINNLTNNSPENPIKRYYSQTVLDNIFKPKDAKLIRNESKLLHEIINKLNNDNVEFGKPTPVSPRKIKSIINYCHVTRDIYFNLTGNQILNLDYSVMEHILPLISGQGAKYENRLESLKKCLEENGLLKSQKELSSIISKGQDYKNFSFFN